MGGTAFPEVTEHIITVEKTVNQEVAGNSWGTPLAYAKEVKKGIVGHRGRRFK